MMRIEDYEAMFGITKYDCNDMRDIDMTIEEKGFSECMLDDVEMGYFLRAGYKIEVIEKHDPFCVIYVHCRVTK